MKVEIQFAVAALVRLWDVATGRNLRRKSVSSVVLVYHDVPDSARNRFRQHAKWLQENTKTMPPNQLAGPIGPLPSVLVTFDDALAGVFRNALPILADAGIPALIFVPTACLGCRPGWKQRSNVIDRREIVATRDTLVANLAPLVHYGSHGRTHLSLLDAGENDARNEIFGSKAELEVISGRPVEGFAFPYGHYASVHVNLCREAGYKSVFSSNPQVSVENLDGYVVPRVPVASGDSLAELSFKVNGAYRWQGLAGVFRRQFSSRFARAKVLPRLGASAPKRSSLSAHGSYDNHR